eukprot:scaffold151508_cov29-Tisochrysis_lutea.AAC.3
MPARNTGKTTRVEGSVREARAEYSDERTRGGQKRIRRHRSQTPLELTMAALPAADDPRAHSVPSVAQPFPPPLPDTLIPPPPSPDASAWTKGGRVGGRPEEPSHAAPLSPLCSPTPNQRTWACLAATLASCAILSSAVCAVCLRSSSPCRTHSAACRVRILPACNRLSAIAASTSRASGAPEVTSDRAPMPCCWRDGEEEVRRVPFLCFRRFSSLTDPPGGGTLVLKVVVETCPGSPDVRSRGNA